MGCKMLIFRNRNMSIWLKYWMNKRDVLLLLLLIFWVLFFFRNRFSHFHYLKSIRKEIRIFRRSFVRI